MAIVFVSPKKKQILFFSLIAGFFLLVLIIVILIVFLIKPEPVLEERVFKKPNIVINFSVLDSDELKNLNQLDSLENQFNYQATTDLGEQVLGRISAISEQVAREKLEQNKLINIKLEIVNPGRDNPFSVYYSQEIIKELETK